MLPLMPQATGFKYIAAREETECRSVVAYLTLNETEIQQYDIVITMLTRRAAGVAGIRTTSN